MIDNIGQKNIVKRAIVVGLSKAGTSSIDAALSSVGYITIHQYYNQLNASVMINRCLTSGQPAFLTVEEKICSDSKNLNNLKVGYTQLDFCLSNGTNIWPQLTHLEDICDQYHDAYYILNYRNTKEHVSSIDRWYNLREKLTMHEIPGLPRGKGKEDKDLFYWIENTVENTGRILQAKNVKFIKLKIDAEDAGSQLSKFIGEKVSWGCMNENDTRRRG